MEEEVEGERAEVDEGGEESPKLLLGCQYNARNVKAIPMGNGR